MDRSLDDVIAERQVGNLHRTSIVDNDERDQN